MAFVPYPAIQVNVIGSYLGQLVENVWYCATAGATPTLSDLDTIGGIFQTAYAALQIPLSTAYTVGQVDCRFLGLEAGPENSFFITPPQAGGNASPGLPGNVAFCVRLRTGLPGRSNRGRKYFAGLTEGSVVGNEFDSTVADTIVSAIGSLMSALSAAGFPLAVLSRTAATVHEVVQAGYYDLVVDSQRRRLPGRGR